MSQKNMKVQEEANAKPPDHMALKNLKSLGYLLQAMKRSQSRGKKLLIVSGEIRVIVRTIMTK